MLGNNIDEIEYGDELWSFQLGDCKVTKIDLNQNIFLAKSIKTEEEIWYTFDGRESGKFHWNIEQSIFWEKPNFEIPNKPFNLKRAIRKIAKLEGMYDENYFLMWSNEKNKIVMGSTKENEVPNTIYFTYTSIVNLLNEIENKKITKEKFLKVMKEMYLEMVK